MAEPVDICFVPLRDVILFRRSHNASHQSENGKMQLHRPPHRPRHTTQSFAVNIAPMVRDEEIERIAVDHVIAHEKARGWVVECVEKDNRGFDLISPRLHPEDPKTAIEVRFIEVKGRAGKGEVAVTGNEFNTAQRLKTDYWHYAVFNYGSTPQLHFVQNPALLGWEPVVRVEHYHVGANAIIFGAAKQC